MARAVSPVAEPRNAYVVLPREELDVLRRTLEAVACGQVDGVWEGLRQPIEYLRAALEMPPAGEIGEELACCADCHQSYTVWYADNDLWNAVMRPNGEQSGEPFLCARCFLIRAERVTTIARVTWPSVPVQPANCADCGGPAHADCCAHDGECSACRRALGETAGLS
jgi:hypothetical protein